MSQFPLRTMVLAAILAFVQASAASAQESQERFVASPDEFRNSCASCHGEDGRGAGFLTRIFRGVDPGDLTQLSKNNDTLHVLHFLLYIISSVQIAIIVTK